MIRRRRKGVFGPAMGRKYVIFIDDINLPQKEEFGAQPPLEFLRQWLDHQYFYDKKDTSKVELVDSVRMTNTNSAQTLLLLGTVMWYTLKFTSIIQSFITVFFQLFLAAMGPPGGGRNCISERLLRHMNIFTINPFDDNTLEKIYGTIAKWHLGGHSDSAMQRLHKV